MQHAFCHVTHTNRMLHCHVVVVQNSTCNVVLNDVPIKKYLKNENNNYRKKNLIENKSVLKLKKKI